MAVGYQIVAISADRPSRLRHSIGRHSLTYTLLSDSTMAGARAFGLAWIMPPKMVARYKLINMNIETASGREHHIVPVPAVFVLDTTGVIVYQYANPDHRVRLDGAVLLEAARAALE